MKTGILVALSAAAISIAGSAFGSSVQFASNPSQAARVTYNIVSAPMPDTGPLKGKLDAFFTPDGYSFGLVQSILVSETTDQGPEFRVFDESSSFVNAFFFSTDDGGVDIGETYPVEFPGVDEDDSVNLTAGLYTSTGKEVFFDTLSENGEPAYLGSAGFGIFYGNEKTDGSGNVYRDIILAYSDRGAEKDADFNDLLVRTEGNVNVVPLPAAGWMLLAGIGGLAAMQRRK